MSTKPRLAKGARVEYGDVSLPDEAFEPRNVRIRISIMVPEDVLGHLKTMAVKQGLGYQTLVNQILRDATDEENSVSARLERIERAVSRGR